MRNAGQWIRLSNGQRSCEDTAVLVYPLIFSRARGDRVVLLIRTRYPGRPEEAKPARQKESEEMLLKRN